MNARTCQLCGKPLSRFAVGSGGDFCSREHRNQYRLRLGMDRLMEANKVASLMRRRENAKQISAEFLLADCNSDPRSYPPVRIARTVYIPVTKRADASTLAVIQAVKAAIPDFKKAVPEDVDVRLEFDQSPYVTNSIRGLIAEGLLGAVLTGLMVLIFLRDWRSALIVVINIPFALLSAVILLWGVGQTINIMTLGGLALAVGVLVDEATVEIENIHTQMLPGVSRARAVVEACTRTAMARLLSMFCILAVFVPSFFMVGVSRQLFVPLSMAVGFSMIAS